MRLISATLRNCRLHRELKVDFDPERTLIGGPNETGKSTFIEAVHRGLFLKAKGNTEHHRALISNHGGHPEIELTFEVAGQKYQLRKRFGTAGTTTLAPSNSVALSGDAAETELARLLGVEAGVTGKAVTTQWAHLWVWQGQSSDDPSVHATAQQAGLLHRLQQMGGAAALQSELDARVAKHFTDYKAQIFTQNDKPKTGSDLERAERAVALAGEELIRARERMRKLDTAVADLENASHVLGATTASLVELEGQQEAIEGKARQLGELRELEIDQSHLAKEARDRQSALEGANAQILNAQRGVAELELSLKPQMEAIGLLGRAVEKDKARWMQAEQSYRTATEAARSARLRHELAIARTQLFEKTGIHAKLDQQKKKVAERRRALAELQQALAKLPKVDKAKLQKLHKLETACSSAQATLQAMATGLEIIAADQPVKAAGLPIKAGEKQILTEDTEVLIGSSVRLRIQPGGSTSLAEARQMTEEALKELRENLDSLGLKSVPAAAEALTLREEISSHCKAAEAELEGMGAESLDDELQAALNELNAVQANLNRFAELVPDETTPDDKAAAQALVKALGVKLSDAEDREIEAKATRDRATEALERAEEALKEKKAECDERAANLTGLKAQLDLLLRTHGDDTARTKAMAECEAGAAVTVNRLRTTTDAIAALQPDLLDSDRNRIARAIRELNNERNESRTKIAVCQASLRSDGSEDPQAALTTAEAKARSVADHHKSVERNAQAVALLDELFQVEQRALSEQFTQPLAEKISGYLQCIFGAGARAKVELENNEFIGLRLFRPDSGGATFAFDTLSGGAREQTAGAVRLAMAEVLAADHGGCLPVVFDDAFAYSDPERVTRLQRMLDLAATRGLQVIILTCNPADYAALGARQTLLHRQAQSTQRELPTTQVPTPNKLLADELAAPTEGDFPSEAAPVLEGEFHAEFLSRLHEFGGKAGNGGLREALGWDEATYDTVKAELVSGGKVLLGRGRGGSVALTDDGT
mgnify:CR=1 FL=1